MRPAAFAGAAGFRKCVLCFFRSDAFRCGRISQGFPPLRYCLDKCLLYILPFWGHILDKKTKKQACFAKYQNFLSLSFGNESLSRNGIFAGGEGLYRNPDRYPFLHPFLKASKWPLP
ncbi:hypothetical protein [Compostibacter hankyongensis]|uniref:hypothetical protein n=1 Tax=Compostibacter hankyongensis TaxID=1007089 RepID=UPI0031E86F5B